MSFLLTRLHSLYVCTLQSQVENFHLQAICHVQLHIFVVTHYMQARVLFSNITLYQQTSVSLWSLLDDSEMSNHCESSGYMDWITASFAGLIHF